MKTTLKPIGYFFLFLLIALIATSCGSSRRSIGLEQGWELLGERKVNFVRDRDAVTVTSTNQFTAIRFKVDRREIRLNNLKVFFQNGDKLEPSLDDVIPPDQYSRIINLALDGRYINRIEFTYRTTGNVLKGRGRVTVIGKKYNPGY